MRGENRTTDSLNDDTTLAIWTANTGFDTTYFTIQGQSFIEMVEGKIPECFWRVIHNLKDTTKPFITHHIGNDMLVVIDEADPIFKRLFNAHVSTMEDSE